MNPFVWALPSRLADALRGHGVERTFERGAALHRTGTRADAVFELLDGRVRMERHTKSGKPLTLTLLFPGSWFGDLASLLDGPRTDDAIAETPVRVRVVRRSQFLSVLRANPELQFDLLQTMASRLVLALSSVEEASLSNLPLRLAARLVWLHEAVGGDELPVTQQRLSELLGVTRENVARVLASWAKAGVVRNLHGRLEVRDVKALKRLTQLGPSHF